MQWIWIRNNEKSTYLDCIAAVWGGAPPEEPVALDKAIGDEVLIFELHPRVADKRHHRQVVHHDPAPQQQQSVEKKEITLLKRQKSDVDM